MGHSTSQVDAQQELHRRLGPATDLLNRGHAEGPGNGAEVLRPHHGAQHHDSWDARRPLWARMGELQATS